MDRERVDYPDAPFTVGAWRVTPRANEIHLGAENETISKNGYRLIAEVRHDTPDVPALQPSDFPPWRRRLAGMLMRLPIIVVAGLWLASTDEDPEPPASSPDAVEMLQKPGIAVLPFGNLGGDPRAGLFRRRDRRGFDHRFFQALRTAGRGPQLRLRPQGRF